jgi:hypothetical protein
LCPGALRLVEAAERYEEIARLQIGMLIPPP